MRQSAVRRLLAPQFRPALHSYQNYLNNHVSFQVRLTIWFRSLLLRRLQEPKLNQEKQIVDDLQGPADDQR